MKKLLIALLLLSGCTSSTEDGPCIGAFDTKEPGVKYKLSAWNIGVGILFFSAIIPPVLVLADETFCPVEK
jgi:hypothetical protein